MVSVGLSSGRIISRRGCVGHWGGRRSLVLTRWPLCLLTSSSVLTADRPVSVIVIVVRIVIVVVSRSPVLRLTSSLVTGGVTCGLIMVILWYTVRAEQVIS